MSVPEMSAKEKGMEWLFSTLNRAEDWRLYGLAIKQFCLKKM